METLQAKMYKYYSSQYSDMFIDNASFLRNDTDALVCACDNFALNSRDECAFESLKSWVNSVDSCLDRTALVIRIYDLIAKKS